MVTRLPTLLLRCSLLVALCAAVPRTVWGLTRDPLLTLAVPLHEDGPAALARMPLDQVLAGGCAAALLGCTAWLLATTALVVVARLSAALAPGSRVVSGLDRLATRACPAAARLLVTAALGLTVGATATAPAHADPAGSTPPDGSTGLTGLALPDRATGAAPQPQASRTAALRPAAVVVRRGDSLWSIAADLLPDGAAAGDVTTAWHRLHHANVARIGDDPDLILPGTRLVVPEPLAPTREERP